MKGIALLAFVLISVTYSYAQVFTNKVVGEKNQDKIEDIKSTDWPYALPILGKQATSAGYDLPYSAGISLNYISQESSLTINNLQIGVNNSPLVNLDEIVRFNDATAASSGVNIRPDIWIFPFLNIYGIVASLNTSTEVDFGVFIPNENSYEEVFTYNTKAEFSAISTGFGITPTMGVGGGWIALDMNFTWTDIEELEKPAYSFIFGPRMGKSFQLKNPESSIAVWVGGFRVNLRSETKGGITLSEVLPFDGQINDKIDAGFEKLDEKQQELDTWWDGLTPAQKRLNQIKYDAANGVLGKANELLFRVSDAAQTAENSTIKYSLDKRLRNRWNFLVGSQFQINKHWMIRAEYGFLGTRNQFISGLQYRFGL